MLNIISSSRYKINRKLIKKTLNEVFTGYNLPDNAIINLVFIGKKKMRDIAVKYKQENVALPVLSFAFDSRDKETHSESPYGEIFICYPQAVLLAAERQKKVDDMLTNLIKHGLDNILK
ncbi:hypothetical protein A2954_03085 [Candidatus Roizmanbacteria bacterium RIFCSPLOWO2_01_FULL_37_12]|uniref:rRNA maturation RNase YbeY n=1 Tax=Candidatus Roizmanbacteria bacterium RIFCSPLOWO2_01_FULL_37_12 TaxID=1802056 RepID=A0A1F7IAH8_9BACT|nr:MAG: hypothetical protein A3D76_04255 [Candidatus Roizmanbacteria bacterium RIFCSPHIGHO2_02_FULL_37_9b]OGK40360.1 MAG: hypothetical protein A2954_03085 [Candidatus Roizmanbacteria bacterium RIFCSPLOWO2_01_FULL_37_12]